METTTQESFVRVKMEERLRYINFLLVPLLRLRNDPVKTLWEKRIRDVIKPVEVEMEPDKSLVTIRINTFKFGAKRNVYLVMYVSAQESKKRPYQAETIAQRINRKLKRIKGDIVVMVVAKKGLTIGAYKTIKEKTEAVVTKSIEEAKKKLLRFLAGKWQALVRAIKASGGRVFGPLAMFMAFLAKIMQSLGAHIEEGVVVKLVEAATGGPEVQVDDIPPPLVE